MSMMVSFVLSFFPRDVLDEIFNLIESVSEDFLTTLSKWEPLDSSNFTACPLAYAMHPPLSSDLWKCAWET